jgi:hypothetical protein
VELDADGSPCVPVVDLEAALAAVRAEMPA